MCTLQWVIIYRSAATNDVIGDIVKTEVVKFKKSGHSFASYGIDEGQFSQISIKGAQSFHQLMYGHFDSVREVYKQDVMKACMAKSTEKN